MDRLPGLVQVDKTSIRVTNAVAQCPDKHSWRLIVVHSKKEYFKSLGAELEAQALRVRQLIGSAHWGHDGRHKELLLQNLIRRHCPSTVLVSTGFVVSPATLNIRSLEQDILIIDTSVEAPLFHQGHLAITFPQALIAAISVKSTMDDETVKDVITEITTRSQAGH